MELYPSDILIHCINIIVLYILLRAILFKPVRAFMLERSKKIQEQMKEAEANERASEEVRKEYKDKIAAAENEALEIKKEGEHAAMESADAILAAAKRDAEQILSDAREKAAAESRQAEMEMQDQLLDAAVDMASLILKREVRPEDNKAVVEEFLKKEGV